MDAAVGSSAHWVDCTSDDERIKMLGRGRCALRFNTFNKQTAPLTRRPFVLIFQEKATSEKAQDAARVCVDLCVCVCVI